MSDKENTLQGQKRPLDNEENSSLTNTATETKKYKDIKTRNRELTTVLVSNLPKSYNNHKIKKIFIDCGPIADIYTTPAPDNKSRLSRIEFVRYDGSLAALTKTLKFAGKNQIEVRPFQNSTLWMTNFPPKFHVYEIRNMFQQINIFTLNIRFPSLRFNSNRRFCYVDLLTEEDTNTALSLLNNKDVNGYNLIAKRSDPKQKTERTDTAVIEKREILVRNLSPTLASKELLESTFSKYGKIISIRLVLPSSNTNLEEGKEQKLAYAFIVFETPDGSQRALALHKSIPFDNESHEITVNISDKKAYLERQEVKRLLNLRKSDKLSLTVSIFPISDKVSKDMIKDFLSQQNISDLSLIDKIYLVPDHEGCLIVTKNEQFAAKLLLSLNGKTFEKRTLHCGDINDLKRHKVQNISKGKENDNNGHKLIHHNPKTSHLENSISSTNNVVSKSGNLTNDDFRKLFLGK